MLIRKMFPDDCKAVVSLWNRLSENKETVYRPLSEADFEKLFTQAPDYDADLSMIAEDHGSITGFINGVAKKNYLQGETAKNTPGYLTCVMVLPEYRGRGLGQALLETLEQAFRAAGKNAIVCNGNNPINLPWLIPGTPGHDHNNAPGCDTACAGYAFLRHLGYADLHHEAAMYLDLKRYRPWEELSAVRGALAQQGISTGRYDAARHCDFDLMCDHVGSEYWRKVLKTEIACHETGTPCTDPRFLPDGRVPAGPRPVLAAVYRDRIVGFTGPVDLQQSGRGWFTGICTDPEFEKRGIASVLFNLLMQEFIEEGALFSSIFTGVDNHAQKIYRRAGFTQVREFAIMKKDLV